MYNINVHLNYFRRNAIPNRYKLIQVWFELVWFNMLFLYLKPMSQIREILKYI